MISKENPKLPTNKTDGLVQLWARARGMYCNLASGFVTQSPPELCSGGILADDMGLGKTLQIISLILVGGPGSTLIVAPVGVMSNWKQQIERHVKSDQAPSVLIYHGDRKMHAKELMQYDVVITSYGRLARELDPKVQRALLDQSVTWRRVVLDEGHTIRNARTKIALAACEIQAKSRWVLSGTPMYVPPCVDTGSGLTVVKHKFCQRPALVGQVSAPHGRNRAGRDLQHQRHPQAA